MHSGKSSTHSACVHTHLRTLGEWAAQQSLPAVSGSQHWTPRLWVSGPGALDLKLLWAHTLLGVRPRSSEAASGPGHHTERASLVAQTVKGPPAVQREKHSRLPRDGQPLRPLGNDSQGSTDARLPPRQNIMHAGHPSGRLLAAQVPFSSLQPSLHPRQEPGTRALRGLFLRWLPVPGAPPLGHTRTRGQKGHSQSGAEARRPHARFLPHRDPRPPSAALPTTSSHLTPDAGWAELLTWNSLSFWACSDPSLLQDRYEREKANTSGEMGNAEQALTQQPSEQSGCTRHHRSLNEGFLHSLNAPPESHSRTNTRGRASRL